MKLVSAAALALALGTGCVYTHVSVPLDTDLQQTSLGAKQGESQFQSVLGLVAWGDAGTQAAARDGGISTLNHMDREVFQVLMGVYYRQKTVVYGD